MRFPAASLAFLLSLPLAAQSAPQSDATAVRKVGGAVLPPTLTHQVEPKYPHTLVGPLKSSHVVLGLVIDAQGLPTKIHVTATGGNDFDANAIKAVEQYRFSPATENGKPVPVFANIVVQFHVYDHPPTP